MLPAFVPQKRIVLPLSIIAGMCCGDQSARSAEKEEEEEKDEDADAAEDCLHFGEKHTLISHLVQFKTDRPH